MSIIPERLPKKPHEYIAGLLALLGLGVWCLAMYVIVAKVNEARLHTETKTKINSQSIF